MASTLHTQYGYSYNNLKVLLGGWNTWNEKHGTDATGYPTDGDPSAGQQPAPLQSKDGTPIPLVAGSPVVINSNSPATVPAPKP